MKIPYLGTYGALHHYEAQSRGFALGSQHTYVVHAVSTDLVKIGKTNNLEKRLATIQTYCPFEIHVVKFLLGDCEAELHGHFANQRVRGEWFRWCERMRQVLDVLDEYPRFE